MTLIINIFTETYHLFVADRRLTAGAAVHNDEANKAILLNTVDAQLVVTFTGLAQAPAYEIRDWLGNTVTAVAKDGAALHQLVASLKAAATELFKTSAIRRIPPSDRRLTIVLSGYYNGNPRRAFRGFISNFETARRYDPSPSALETFSDFGNLERKQVTNEAGPRDIRAFGSTQALTWSDAEYFRFLLAQQLLASDLRQAVVARMLEIANRPNARSMIGKQLNSVIIPRAAGESSEFSYHSVTAAPVVYAPDFIDCSGVGAGWIKDVSFGRLDGGLTVVPKVPRNRPCPCQSGKKYKHCHGRSP